MIIEVLFDLFEAGITGLATLFPNDPVNLQQYIGIVSENLGALNYFLPIAEIFTLVVAVVVIFPLFAGVSLSLWIVAQLRGSSSVG